MINVSSEIGCLKKVMLHRPGRELLLLQPDSLEELLFDDIPFLKIAQKEHDAFADAMRREGVEVLYLEDLMAEVIKDKEIKDAFIKQYLDDVNLYHAYQAPIKDYLYSIKDEKELVLRTMEGFRKKDLELPSSFFCDFVEKENDILIKPMPNLYFTRDPFACIGSGVAVNKMYSTTRCRETIYGHFIFSYHKDYKDKVPLYYNRDGVPSIEGGDILNLTKKCVAVGLSQRTTSEAIDAFATNVFSNENSTIENILVFEIPKKRAFMHLDTVFTQIDYDKFTVHPGILGPLNVYNIERGKGQLHITHIEATLEEILGKYSTSQNVELIKCGGKDMLVAEREQWNDGSNTLSIAPGKIIVYARNEVTNALLYKKGLKVIEIEDSELSRGRGGPRCMSMPFMRDELK